MHNDRDLTIPALYCPFPAYKSEHYQEVKRNTLFWVENFQLIHPSAIDLFVAADFAAMTCRFYMGDKELMTWANDLLSLLFILDDVADHALTEDLPPDFLASIIQVVQSEVYFGENLLLCALAELWTRPVMISSKLKRELINDLSTLFKGIAWEKQNDQANRVPPFKEYMKMRPAAGGAALAATLVKIVARIDLPDLPELSILADLCARLGCLANDLFSLNKELNHSDNHNVVVVLMQEDKIGLAEAIRKAVHLHNQYMELFERLITQLPKYGKSQRVVDIYIKGLINIVRGNIDWSLLDSNRYGPLDIQIVNVLAPKFHKLAVADI
ncbi:hypothetical protein [Chitinophaga sp. CB10]|uniref:terpene synthase family protein n=1 Tax=Chitinophaga sp. CB10 TaxID=1891659 RepID=UPI0025C2E241|nr:hypothetical protein [Chitinophaga sp. CB10]